jgi:hypothetical protein
MAPHCRPRLIFPLAAVLAFTGCKDSKIAAYRVPKDSGFARPAAAADAASPAVRWQAPPDWQEQPKSGVRLASFLITGAGGAKADMAVTFFPGDVGGDLANLNRWRAQIQLPPVSEADLPGAFARVQAPAGEFLVVDLLSESPVLESGRKARVLGAILKQSAQTWFFKLAGEAGLVAAQKEAFIGFLKSVEFDSTAAAAAAVAVPGRVANTNDLPPDARGGPVAAPLAEGSLPPGHPSIEGSTPAVPAAAGADMAAIQVPTAGDQALVWTAPAQWTPKKVSAMRRGSYTVSGPEGAADLSITAFPGDVGGDLANVNRWRGQLQLPSVPDLTGALQPLEANGLRILVFDGANDGTRMLGAIVPRAGETWFFKLTGPDALVTREKPAFLDFLKTVKAP